MRKRRFFGWFNALFDKSVEHYSNSVSGILRKTGRYLWCMSLSSAAWRCCSCACQPPSCPKRIRGVYDNGSAPGGATQTRTQQVLDQVQDYYLNKEKPMLNPSLPLTALALAARVRTPVWPSSA
jgi:multidrug efflux pump